MGPREKKNAIVSIQRGKEERTLPKIAGGKPGGLRMGHGKREVVDAVVNRTSKGKKGGGGGSQCPTTVAFVEKRKIANGIRSDMRRGEGRPLFRCGTSCKKKVEVGRNERKATRVSCLSVEYIYKKEKMAHGPSGPKPRRGERERKDVQSCDPRTRKSLSYPRKQG